MKLQKILKKYMEDFKDPSCIEALEYFDIQKAEELIKKESIVVIHDRFNYKHKLSKYVTKYDIFNVMFIDGKWYKLSVNLLKKIKDIFTFSIFDALDIDVSMRYLNIPYKNLNHYRAQRQLEDWSCVYNDKIRYCKDNELSVIVMTQKGIFKECL